MLSISTSSYSNLHYEADEIQSSSSSSLSFENNESSLYNYYNHYQNTPFHSTANTTTNMSEHHQQQDTTTDLTFNDSDWSMNKSPPQPSFYHHQQQHQRDDRHLYSPIDGAAASSYSSYDNYDSISSSNHHNHNSQFPPIPTVDHISMQQQEPIYHSSNHMGWNSSSTDSHDVTPTISNNISGTSSSPTTKLEHHHHIVVPPSPDFFLPSSKKHQQFPNNHHLMNMFPLPPPPPPPHHHSTMNNNTMFCQQRPSHHHPVNKGDRYHPRFKSANARLSPFTEQQQELYQHLLTTSSSSSSSPPQHYHSLMEEQVIIKEEDEEGDNNNVNDQQRQQQFYHSYQSSTKKEFDSNTSSTNDQSQFQFDVVLHASTAVRKKHDEQPVTYLNRGQAYLIDLNTNNHSPQEQHFHPGAGTMTSTISIAFHESSHRQIAENYWKYWISQQEIPKEARAIGLDTNQTTGIYNIRFSSFDRVSFDWNGRFGAKVYVRFNCLSTDFSRIKGVKGIPLRCVMETKANYLTLPDDSILYKGTFQKMEGSNMYQYQEIRYCKIKLFRDKGAERKNKDDKKQMAKQMEKVIASTNGNPQQHPLWPIISQPHRSTSILSEVPSSPDIVLNDFDDITSNPLLSIMAPLPATTTTSPQQSSSPSSSKRKRSSNNESKSLKKGGVNSEDKKRRNSKESPTIPSSSLPVLLSFYVWTRHIHSTPHEITLEQLTTHTLKIKLGEVLSIHPARISEILWKRKRSTSTTEQPEANVDNNVSDVLVLVEDTFIAEHIVDGEMMTVDLEIKADGNLRLVLEF